MEEKFNRFVQFGQYEMAAKILLSMEEKLQYEVVSNYAVEEESLSIYGFLIYLLRKFPDHSIKWHDMAFDVLSGPLCWFEGGYTLALHHTRELIRLKDCIEYRSYLLLFAYISTNLVEKEEAILIAKEVQKKYPGDQFSLEILERYDK